MRICHFMFAVCLSIAGCDPSEPPSSSAVGEAPVDRQKEPMRDPVVGDEESIIGFWKVVEASVDGDPYSEAIGKIHEFRRGNELRFITRENEGRKQYRMDAKKNPKTLVSWFFNPEIASFGIYELSSNELRWRFSLDKQELQFSEIPQGSWWEYRFVRITADAAGPAIKALQERRMANED